MGNICSKSEESSRNAVDRGHIVPGNSNIVAENLTAQFQYFQLSDPLEGASRRGLAETQTHTKLGMKRRSLKCNEETQQTKNEGDSDRELTSPQPEEDLWVRIARQEHVPSGGVSDNHANWFKLVNYYRTETCWMEPFPWNHEQPQDLANYYTSITFQRYDRTGNKKSSENVELEKLFDPVEKGGLRPSRVLVRGEPGSGKTTLCRKLCYDWCMGVTTVRELPNRITLPVFYSLRQLSSRGNLKTELVNYIRQFQTSEKGLKNTLSELGANFLLILDGYDEVSEVCKEEIRQILVNPNDPVFNHATFLVTSRHTEDWNFLKLFDKHFYIDKLTEEKVTDLVKRFYGEHDALRDAFFSEHSASSLIDLPPLVIFMLCWITSDLKTTSCKSREGVIGDFILHLAERCNQRENFGLNREEIEKILIDLGLSFLISENVRHVRVSESTLRSILKSNYLFSIRIGILKEVKYYNDYVMYEPLHKLLWDHLEGRFEKHFEYHYNEFRNNTDEIQKLSEYVRSLGFSGIRWILDVSEGKIQNRFLQFFREVSQFQNVSLDFLLKEESFTLCKDNSFLCQWKFRFYCSSWNANLLREMTQLLAPNSENSDVFDSTVRLTESMPEYEGEFRHEFEIRTSMIPTSDVFYKLLHWVQSKTTTVDNCVTRACLEVTIYENLKECLDEIVDCYVRFREVIHTSILSENHSLPVHDISFQNELIMTGQRKRKYSSYAFQELTVCDRGITFSCSDFEKIFVLIFFPIQEFDIL